MTARRIAAHKGGRTARAPEARMTPSERGRLDTVLQRRGVKYVDWLIGNVNKDYEQLGRNEMTQSAITSKNYSSIREMSHSGRGIVIGKKDGGWYWEVDPDTAGRAPHGPHKTAQAAIDDAKEFIDAA